MRPAVNGSSKVKQSTAQDNNLRHRMRAASAWVNRAGAGQMKTRASTHSTDKVQSPTFSLRATVMIASVILRE